MDPIDDLAGLLGVIAAGDCTVVRASLDAVPQLATTQLARREERFLTECQAQAHEGDTALHVAAFAYDSSSPRTW